ncbi:hypothetical protein SAMN04487938_0919 [Lysobacter sp. cf310]|nr:hypothetical protein SAMN04487938_0919 [Lysobacter sp. cf310]
MADGHHRQPTSAQKECGFAQAFMADTVTASPGRRDGGLRV